MHIFPADIYNNPQKGRVDVMDNGKKKIWICLLTAVLAAALIGLIYYFSTSSEYSSEGFLIYAPYEWMTAAAGEENCNGIGR